MAEASSRCAVVTGANRGIGLEVCKQLASNGVKVVLTARDENRGLKAVRRIEEAGLSGRVVFHPLDVTDPASVASLADFINAKFGKLDILVNNAGVLGANFRPATDDDLRATGLGREGAKINLEGLTIETPELAEECLDIVYYGAKRTVKALFPYLQLSDSPRIVLVSSYYGRLKNVSNEWAMRVLADKENLTEERVDEVLQVYLRDFKEGSLKTKGWPTLLSAYIVSKAALNAYAQILAKKHPSVYVNSVCPGIVKTDMTLNMGILSVEEGAGSIVRLALMPNGGPSGWFFRRRRRDPILNRL